MKWLTRNKAFQALKSYFWPVGADDSFANVRARLMCAFSGLILVGSILHDIHLYLVKPDLSSTFWIYTACCLAVYAITPGIWHLTHNMRAASLALITVFVINKCVMLSIDGNHLFSQEVFFLSAPVLTMVLLGSVAGWIMTIIVAVLLVALAFFFEGFSINAAIAVSMSAAALMAGITLFFGEVLKKERRLVELRNEAQRATREKSEFLAKMSHEIRTPLNGLSGILQLLDETDLTDDQKHLVATGRASGRSLMRLINDVLDYSKIAANGVTVEQISVQLQDILETVRQSQEAPARAKGLDLVLKLDPHLPEWIVADPVRINQILINFVGNAIKFSDRGTITCCAALHDGCIRFSVKDQGIGLTKEAQLRIFNKFEQASSTTNRHFGGTGLGLAICKELAELMGGEIGVDSVPIRGSTFWFQIPLIEGAPAQSPTNVTVTDAVQMDFDGAQVLVIEDNRTNQMIIRRFLESMNVTLDMVDDGRPGLQLCDQKAYDLVLMDIQLPVMDGVEATKILRARPGPNREVPIVALTANIQPEQTNSYLQAGMNACLGKPFRKDELAKVMSALLTQRSNTKPAAYSFDEITPVAKPPMRSSPNRR